MKCIEDENILKYIIFTLLDLQRLFMKLFTKISGKEKSTFTFYHDSTGSGD